MEKRKKYSIFLLRISVEENNCIGQLEYFSSLKMFVGGENNEENYYKFAS